MGEPETSLYGDLSESRGLGAWGLVDTGAQPVVALYLGNEVDGEVTIGGVDILHHTATVDYLVLERRGRVPLRQAWAPLGAPLP